VGPAGGTALIGGEEANKCSNSMILVSAPVVYPFVWRGGAARTPAGNPPATRRLPRGLAAPYGLPCV